MRYVTATTLALLACQTPSLAQAADLNAQPYAAPVVEEPFHRFQIRLQGSAVLPDGTSKNIDSLGLLPSFLGLTNGRPGGQVYGSSVHTTSSFAVGGDLTFFLTPNWAVSTIFGYTNASFSTTGTLSGHKVGSASPLPFTALFQYHFTNFGAFQPYVGVGPVYTSFFNVRAAREYAPFITAIGLTGLAGVSDLHLSGSWGVAAQAGFDYMINDTWGINFDVKRAMIRPTAYTTIPNPVLNSNVWMRTSARLDPWILSAGLTYRFDGETITNLLVR